MKDYMKQFKEDSVIKEELIKLRDVLSHKAFEKNGDCKDPLLAEVFFKINSCLYVPRGKP